MYKVELREDLLMMDKIIGALTFRKGVYAEVESDDSFTSSAWIIVIVAAFLSALGSAFGSDAGAGGAIVGAIGATIFAVIGFIVGVAVVNFVGKTLFSADVDFQELLRTLGLAYVWNVVGVLAIIPILGGFIGFIAAILGFVAALIAVKEALDLGWGQTIVTLVIAWIAIFIVLAIGGAILAAIGIGAAVGLGVLEGLR